MQTDKQTDRQTNGVEMLLRMLSLGIAGPQVTLVVERQRNFCRPVEYWFLGRCRCWRWQNEDDNDQRRW